MSVARFLPLVLQEEKRRTQTQLFVADRKLWLVLLDFWVKLLGSVGFSYHYGLPFPARMWVGNMDPSLVRARFFPLMA